MLRFRKAKGEGLPANFYHQLDKVKQVLTNPSTKPIDLGLKQAIKSAEDQVDAMKLNARK